MASLAKNDLERRVNTVSSFKRLDTSGLVCTEITERLIFINSPMIQMYTSLLNPPIVSTLLRAMSILVVADDLNLKNLLQKKNSNETI